MSVKFVRSYRDENGTNISETHFDSDRADLSVAATAWELFVKFAGNNPHIFLQGKRDRQNMIRRCFACAKDFEEVHQEVCGNE